MILFLDPSSTCIGYALYGDMGHLCEAGRFKPARASDPAWVRAQTMAGRVLAFLDDDVPGPPIHRVVMEIPDGKVARRIRGASAGAGLSLYGLAVGVVAGRLIERGLEVEGIEVNRWTRGVAKSTRQAGVAARVKGYRVENDPGGDVSDAIALGEWWFVEHKLAEMRK